MATSLNTPAHSLISPWTQWSCVVRSSFCFLCSDEVGEDVSPMPSPSLHLMVFHVEADADAVVVNLVRREEMDIKTQLIGLMYEHLGWKGGEQRRWGRGRNTPPRSEPSSPNFYLMWCISPSTPSRYLATMRHWGTKAFSHYGHQTSQITVFKRNEIAHTQPVTCRHNNIVFDFITPVGKLLNGLDWFEPAGSKLELAQSFNLCRHKIRSNQSLRKVLKTTSLPRPAFGSHLAPILTLSQN